MSRTRRQLVAFALVAVVSLYAGFTSYETGRDVKRIEPKITRVTKATAACRAEILDSAAKVADCARRIEVGLSACRRDGECRSAFLRLMRSAVREGVVPGGNNPSGLAPGQEDSPGPETQPSPEGPESDAGAPRGLDSATDDVEEAVEEVADDVDQVVEEVCIRSRELLHLC